MKNKTVWIFIIIAIIILIVVYNSSQKKLRDAKQKFDEQKETETKVITKPDPTDPAKPPVTTTIPATANFDIAHAVNRSELYAGEVLTAYTDANKKDLYKIFTKGALIGKYDKVATYTAGSTNYVIDRQEYAYNYFFPIGFKYLPTGVTKIYVSKEKKLYVKRA